MTLFTVYLIIALAGAFIAFWRAPQWPRFNLLLLIAAIPQIGNVLGVRISGMFLVSVAAIVIWCLCNHEILGVLVVAAGAVMNLLVMAMHGGAMPVRADILADLGYHFDVGTLLAGSKDVVVHGSPFWMLSDWLAISTDLFTLLVSPGDLLIVGGILVWLLLSREPEREQPMLAFHVTPTVPEKRARLVQGQSARPALTRLALLAAADPALAERLLRDPLDAAAAHPHFRVPLDANDRATLVAIRARTHTIGEFLGELAAEVDGA